MTHRQAVSAIVALLATIASSTHAQNLRDVPLRVGQLLPRALIPRCPI
jgi:hypothetical protein